nr:MAG TPA: hypothetical protein [Caudoviricetes sp.]
MTISELTERPFFDALTARASRKDSGILTVVGEIDTPFAISHLWYSI